MFGVQVEGKELKNHRRQHQCFDVKGISFVIERQVKTAGLFECPELNLDRPSERVNLVESVSIDLVTGEVGDDTRLHASRSKPDFEATAPRFFASRRRFRRFFSVCLAVSLVATKRHRFGLRVPIVTLATHRIGLELTECHGDLIE